MFWKVSGFEHTSPWVLNKNSWEWKKITTKLVKSIFNFFGGEVISCLIQMATGTKKNYKTSLFTTLLICSFLVLEKHPVFFLLFTGAGKAVCWWTGGEQRHGQSGAGDRQSVRHMGDWTSHRWQVNTKPYEAIKQPSLVLHIHYT